ncbi:FGGY-family carbohydrate kinase [Arthrobacter tumbae]|uniref:FGGY-family carbohydrate kinase n=1 Tax=Arthrobacter tumbae TaxID=163874 RepID=UPI001959FF8A|nr:FGGY-family carbohydrate kinase [Arthrobacter tumbae]MBM7780893.1 xylulokinase [Arthrobacter tumbae]
MTAIAVDAGTTMIKAVGYDDAGREAVVVRRSTLVTHPEPGWAEQDMAAVWKAVAESIREVAARLTEPVDFLAITGQGDGSWLVDDAGNPTGPAILWNDGRAASIVEQWRSEGVLGRTYRTNGSLSFAGLPNAILTWLSKHDPERLEASEASLTCNGYLFLKLTGVAAVDNSDGAAPFMDVRAREYSQELFEAYAMEWAADLMPPILRDADRSRPLSAEGAAHVGLPLGIHVVMASYDIAATAIGAGAVLPGQACSILGTTLCTEMVVDRIDTTGVPAGLTVGLGVEDRYLRALPTLAGGEVIQWACTLLNCATPIDFTDLAANSSPGAGGLMFLPYLSPAGERAPFLDSEARGSFLGLSLEHGRPEVARAVLEGLTFVIRDCLEAGSAVPTELRVCGGGAENAVWLQLIATMTGVPVRKLADSEIGARGAFILGLVATGASRSIEDAVAAHVRISSMWEPGAERQFYNELYRDFLTLREDSRRSWPLLARLRSRAQETQ